MIPIKYDESKSKWVICEESDKDWYNYKDGKKWANVMLSDGTYASKETEGKNKATVGTEVEDAELGSMFVWIPRYAYSIKEYKTEKNGSEGTTQNITDVTFLVGTTNKDINAKTYPTDYKTEDAKEGQATPKIVHPAFTFGGEKLTGIWVAKFEASMKEDNNDTSENNNNTSKTLKVVPNVESWRHIQIGNMFKNCLSLKDKSSTYGLTTSTDSHLMKNIEWGAVAYLCSSQYGTTPKQNTKNEKIEMNNGSDNYKIWAAGQDYKTNTNQSTTGNVTGIYDMNGGAWEYVAAYYDNGSSNLSSQGTNDIFSGNQLKSEYTKYWDKYEVSSEEKDLAKDTTFWNSGSEKNSDRKKITDERYELMKNKKGDAMYEVIKDYSYYVKNPSNSYIWDKDEPFESTNYGTSYYNSDYVLIGNTSQPFLVRGGYIWGGTHAGVFASSGANGGAWFNPRFSSCVGCPLALRYTKKHKGFLSQMGRCLRTLPRVKSTNYFNWICIKEVCFL